MKLCCAVLDDYQGVAIELADWSSVLEEVEVRTFDHHLDDPDRLVEAIADCEIVVVMRERTPFPRSLLERLPRLQLLVTSGMRNASIDLDAARELGVRVCGTASRSDPPAELAWALILALSRHLVAEAGALKANGPWQSTIGSDLQGRTLGLLGLGRIGTRVARVGQAFGMEVVAWSQNLTRERAEEEGVRLAASKLELFAAGDVVSIHLVLSERTRGLVDSDALRAMRPHAFLVNTSRAAIVDQDALAHALREGWIAGAGLDVFAVEPLPADDPLRTAPNVLATPHLGYVTRGNYETYFQQAVQNIRAFLDSAPVRELQ